MANTSVRNIVKPKKEITLRAQHMWAERRFDCHQYTFFSVQVTLASINQYTIHLFFFCRFSNDRAKKNFSLISKYLMLKIQFGLTILSQVSKDWANDFVILISNVAKATIIRKRKCASIRSRILCEFIGFAGSDHRQHVRRAHQYICTKIKFKSRHSSFARFAVIDFAVAKSSSQWPM